MTALLEAIEDLCARVGQAAGWLVLALIAVVCATVAAAQLRINVLASWSADLPLLGQQLSLNGLIDMQWHLFAVVILLGGTYAFRTNSHVFVDVFAHQFPPRVKAAICGLGDLFLLVPFAAIMTWYAWPFMMAAVKSGEGSSYGGLVDRWIIKAVLPLGFGLLTVAGLARGIRLVIEALTGRVTATDDETIPRAEG